MSTKTRTPDRGDARPRTHGIGHMSTEAPRKSDARRYSAATAHREAHPNGKAAAIDNGVTYRTERRWRSPRDAQGSPQERYDRYLETAQDPARLEAHNRAKVMERRYRKLTKAQVIGELRALYALDATAEGEETAARFRRGIGWLDRAALHERDASYDIRLSALSQRAHDLGITETDVFGGDA